MSEFMSFIKDFVLTPKTPIEISVDVINSTNHGGISSVAFRTNKDKKYYLCRSMNEFEIHTIATGRQIKEVLELKIF